MPKFNLKPKKILSRLVPGRSRKEEDGIDYLCLGFGRFLLEQHSHAYIGGDHDNDNDCSSILSFSTTATADNLPGTGRVIDMYILQPMGRRIERLAMRFTVASLHPVRIAQYIEANTMKYFKSGFRSEDLHDAITQLCLRWQPNGPTIVAGMKGLVRQTQSNQINRSAIALAALIRVSLNSFHREIYDGVSHIEPVFHLETLAGSLDWSHPEKMFFFLLVKLARATLTANKDPFHILQEVVDPFFDCWCFELRPSSRKASKLRRRLRRVLNLYKKSGFAAPDVMLGEACDICAVAVSTYISPHGRGDAYMHILETVYLTVIFILRSINELAEYSSVSQNRIISVVLQTLTYWTDVIVFQCTYAADCTLYGCDINSSIMFRTLALELFLPSGRPLLPESFKYAKDRRLFAVHLLPRRQRATIHRVDDSPILLNLIRTSTQRTRRLLNSFSELEREAQGSSSDVNGFSQLKITLHSSTFRLSEIGNDRLDHWEYTLEQARRVQVPDNALTKEFIETRRWGFGDPSDSDDSEFGDVCDYEMDWVHYTLRKIVRHQMGQYYRSNMEWDWDLGTCMKRLFKESHPEQPTAVHGAPASSPTIGVAASPEGALQLSIGRAQACMPNEIQVSYQTEDGKMEYMSFVPATPSPGHRPVSSRFGGGSSPEDILDPTVVQQDSGHREGSSGREKEIEDLAAGISLLDVSQPEAYEVIAIEERKDICEGSERKYDGGGDEVRVGGDAISICSLD